MMKGQGYPSSSMTSQINLSYIFCADANENHECMTVIIKLYIFILFYVGM